MTLQCLNKECEWNDNKALQCYRVKQYLDKDGNCTSQSIKNINERLK